MALTALTNQAVPTPVTSLVGRAVELARLLEMVRQPGMRLITLTGPGGVGKTRLALHLIGELEQHDQVETCLVLLASAASDEVAIASIARALGVVHGGLVPPETIIADAIGNRRMLLILDNVEQLADQLSLIPGLLAACPNLTILATSRVMLRLSAEHIFPIDPLPTISRDQAPAPATALFIERAIAVRPDLDLSPPTIAAIDTICQRLDGLPLAIELAAARTRFLPPMLLRDRLSDRLQALVGGPRDAPERHRTLRATIAWSHDLLSPCERLMFQRLAVFENGGPLEAVTAVCNASGDLLEDPEELLASLVDHSLVRVTGLPSGATRVRMLHTIREFALEQLEASGELEPVNRAFAMWFATVVIQTPIETWRTGTSELREWTDYHLPEANNLNKAISILVAIDEPLLAMQMASSLVTFWVEIGQINEVYKWVAQLMPYVDQADPRVQASFYRMATVLSLKDNDLEQALRYCKLAVDLAIRIGDPRLTANNQNLLGQVYWRIGDAAEAERSQQTAIDIMVEIGDPLGGALFASQIADGLIEIRELDRAETLLLDALPMVSRHRPEAAPLLQGSLGRLYLFRDDLNQAGHFLGLSLDYHIDPPHRLPSLLASRLMSIASLAARHGRHQDALALLGAGLALSERSGTALDESDKAAIGELLDSIHPSLSESEMQQAKAYGTTLVNPMSQALDLALSVTSLRMDLPEIVDPVETDAGFDDDSSGLLTPREREVLQLLAEGNSNAAIAEHLFISQRTVTTHLSRLYAKLEVTTRTEAVALAIRLGLVNPPSKRHT
jgi:predicted ATPase/DNA-binding CsgD family transcriptional regulator